LAGEDETLLEQEFVAALSRPLMKTDAEMTDKDAKVDEFEDTAPEDGGVEELKSCVGLTFAQTTKLQNLFEGLVFFINREVPREALVFAIRSFGGQVSWDKTSFIGAPFDAKDTRITHHIIDREQISNKYMNRSYVQPQWIFDSINARTQLNVQDYFPGVTLPPHLSPFVVEAEGDYVAPEVERLRKLQSGMPQDAAADVDEEEDASEESEDEEADEMDNDESEDEEIAPAKTRSATANRNKKSAAAEVNRPKRGRDDNNNNAKKAKKNNKPVEDTDAGDVVRPGKVARENVSQAKEIAAAEDKRLAVMMIPKKKKRLYDKIMFGKKRQQREVATLAGKRQEFDQRQKSSKRTTKR